MTSLLPMTRCEALQLRVDNLELQLREADHRIANALQLAITITNSEMLAATNLAVRTSLREMQDRIWAIAGVHRLLSRSEKFGFVPLHEHLAQLVEALRSSIGENMGAPALVFRCDQVLALAQQVTALGMAVNELVTNAAKHAYPAGQAGEIRIDVAVVDNCFVVTVEDDGAGERTAPSKRGLGHQLLGALAKTMNGELRHERVAQGTRAIFSGSGLTLPVDF